jgi:hypothetical protein
MEGPQVVRGGADPVHGPGITRRHHP